YADAAGVLAAFVDRHDIPLAETQAGKGALPHHHPLNLGALGVTGTSAANAIAAEADVILAIGTRLQDFTTGSWALFREPTRRIVSLKVQILDATKHLARPLVADAKIGIEALSTVLSSYRAPDSWHALAARHKAHWIEMAAKATAASNADPPSDAEVIGAVQ